MPPVLERKMLVSIDNVRLDIGFLQGKIDFFYAQKECL